MAWVIWLYNSLFRSCGQPNMTNDNLSSEESDFGMRFYAILTPFIIIIGIFGNTVSLIIFKKRALRKLSASLYLKAICISDTCVLLTYVLLDWLFKGLPVVSGGAKVSVVSINGLCQLFLFVSYTFRIISVWLIIVFTFERYVAICHPLQRRLICTRSFSFKLIGCVSILASILCLYKPIISSTSNVGTGTAVCSMNHDYRQINWYLDTFYGVCITALPFTIIFFFNTMILRKLVCRKSDMVETLAISRESRMRLEFTFILLSISTCFVCLNFPYFIVACRRFLQSSQSEGSDIDNITIKSAQTTEPDRNSLYFTRTIFYFNYAINFFLYCLTGKQYRKYMIQLFCCRKEEPTSSSAYRSGYTTHSYVFQSERNGNATTAV